MNRTAQSTIEYTVLLAVLVGALVGMQVYVKRSLQGRIRDNSSQISELGYSPGATIGMTETRTETTEKTDTENISDTHKRATNIADITVTINKNEEVLPLEKEPVRW